jgi:carboxylate-amine ligase
VVEYSEFKNKFRFATKHAFKFGVEREFFIADKTGAIVPYAQSVYDRLRRECGDLFTYELSACQIESRTEIVSPSQLIESLRDCEVKLDGVLETLGLHKLSAEVASDDMPLDVYPDPDGRYKRIARAMPREVLLAACQVAGTHVHVGMPDAETALRVYNYVIHYCDELCVLGDNSNGRRLHIYSMVAPDPRPRAYGSWVNFFEEAQREGYAEEPRNCWKLIRITKHGTIEFRMFGATESIEQIAAWAFRCRELCITAAMFD